MIPEERIIEDGDTSESLIDVGPVTQEEVDRADEFLEELFNGGEINGKL